MPQKKTLVELFPCLKQLAILIRLLQYTLVSPGINTAQKMKFSIKDFFSKCDQIWKELRVGHIY